MRIMLICVTLIFVSCGAPQREVEIPSTPVPVPTPTPGGQVSFADVQAVTKVSCLRCHASDGFLKTEAAWRGSPAKTRLTNNSMPPPGTAEARGLSGELRSFLITF